MVYERFNFILEPPLPFPAPPSLKLQGGGVHHSQHTPPSLKMRDGGAFASIQVPTHMAAMKTAQTTDNRCLGYKYMVGLFFY